MFGGSLYSHRVFGGKSLEHHCHQSYLASLASYMCCRTRVRYTCRHSWVVSVRLRVGELVCLIGTFIHFGNEAMVFVVFDSHVLLVGCFGNVMFGCLSDAMSGCTLVGGYGRILWYHVPHRCYGKMWWKHMFVSCMDNILSFVFGCVA